MVEEFTRRLDELYVQQKLDLSEALKIMFHRKNKHKSQIMKAAEYLYRQLELGNPFSNSLRTCPFINFDDFYVSFITMAELTGDLKDAVSYLNRKLERKHKNRMKLLEACIYPVFVIFLAVISSFFLITYTEITSPLLIFKMIFILLICCFCIFLCISKVMCDDRLYETFLIIDFLLKAGVGMSEAVGCGVQILGINTRMGRIFQEAKEKLEYGVNLENALKLGERYEEGFYMADKAGGKTEVFGKMAGWLNQKIERKRRICISLIEPVFLLITGVFLLCLVMNIFMPFMNDMKWM